MARIKIEESEKLTPMTVCISKDARLSLKSLPIKQRKEVIAKIREQSQVIIAGMVSIFQANDNQGNEK